MKTLVTIAGLLAAFTAGTAFGQLTEVRPIGFYQCPNHPEIQATWPARCPICHSVLTDVWLTAGAGGGGAAGAAIGGRGITSRAVPGGREEGGFRSESRGFGREGMEEGREGREFGTREFPNEGFGNEGFENRGFRDDEFGEGFEGEGFGNEGFGDEGFGGEGFGGERFGNEGFGGEGLEREGFGNEGFGGEGFEGEGLGGEDPEGESVGRIAATPEAAAPVRIGDAYFCPRCGMPLRDIQALAIQEGYYPPYPDQGYWPGQIPLSSAR